MTNDKIIREILEVKKCIINIYQVLLTDSNSKKLHLVLTNQDLKDIFQISDSTINRLVKLSSFPDCWYGIRGHYPRDKVLEWFKEYDYEEYQKKMEAIRKL